MKIADIKNWFEVAVPEPTIEQACVQIGCHYEEVAEMLAVTGDSGAMSEVDVCARYYKSASKNYLSDLDLLAQSDSDMVELLDSLCDQIVTAIGVAHMLGMDIEGALDEVNRSNHSKFEDGKAVFNEQGKISKGKDYFAPDLAQYIDKAVK